MQALLAHLRQVSCQGRPIYPRQDLYPLAAGARVHSERSFGPPTGCLIGTTATAKHSGRLDRVFHSSKGLIYLHKYVLSVTLRRRVNCLMRRLLTVFSEVPY